MTAFGYQSPKLIGRPRVGQACLPEGSVESVTPDDTHQQCSDDERFPNFG